MLHRLLCTTASPPDAAFSQSQNNPPYHCLRAGTEASLATGSAVACGGAAPAVLRAAVTEGRALASETAGASAGTIGRNLLGGGGGSSRLSGGRVGSLRGRRRAACAEASLAAGTAVITGGTAPAALRAAVSEGGAGAGHLASTSAGTVSGNLGSSGGSRSSRCLDSGGSWLHGAGSGLGGDSAVATAVTEARLAASSAVVSL